MSGCLHVQIAGIVVLLLLREVQPIPFWIPEVQHGVAAEVPLDLAVKLNVELLEALIRGVDVSHLEAEVMDAGMDALAHFRNGRGRRVV